MVVLVKNLTVNTYDGLEPAYLLSNHFKGLIKWYVGEGYLTAPASRSKIDNKC